MNMCDDADSVTARAGNVSGGSYALVQSGHAVVGGLANAQVEWIKNPRTTPLIRIEEVAVSRGRSAERSRARTLTAYFRTPHD